MACPHCAGRLAEDRINLGTARCPHCRRSFEAVPFQPPQRAPEKPRPAGPGDAARCANHRGNAAEASCDRCGVFMCLLCRIASDAKALCPACFDRLLAADQLESLQLIRQDYGARASTAAAAGFLLCLPLGFLLGPTAIYYGARALQQQSGSLGSRGGILLAMLLGVLEAGFSGFMIFNMLREGMGH
jgi:hypothetical protein